MAIFICILIQILSYFTLATQARPMWWVSTTSSSWSRRVSLKKKWLTRWLLLFDIPSNWCQVKHIQINGKIHAKTIIRCFSPTLLDFSGLSGFVKMPNHVFSYHFTLFSKVSVGGLYLNLTSLNVGLVWVRLMGKEQLFRLVVQTELAFFPARCIFPARNIFCHHLRKKFQLNRFLEEGSVQLLPADQTYQVTSFLSVPNMCYFCAQVNFKKLETSVSNLVRDICTWQHNGDKSVVDAVFAKWVIRCHHSEKIGTKKSPKSQRFVQVRGAGWGNTGCSGEAHQGGRRHQALLSSCWRRLSGFSHLLMQTNKTLLFTDDIVWSASYWRLVHDTIEHVLLLFN